MGNNERGNEMMGGKIEKGGGEIKKTLVGFKLATLVLTHSPSSKSPFLISLARARHSKEVWAGLQVLQFLPRQTHHTNRYMHTNNSQFSF